MRRFLSRLCRLVWPAPAESDLSRELASHLALIEDDLRRRGATPDEAHRAARLALGGVEQTKELHRDARSFVWIEDARRDCRHAVRLLRRQPLFTLTATLSLAIGIGANTTIFTVADALLFRSPTGVAEPRRLVDIGRSQGGGGINPISYPNYLDTRARTTALAGLYAYSMFPHALSFGSATATANAERVFGTWVTNNYFAVLGAVPAAGRLISPTDTDRPGASPVVVLSHGFWTRRFNKDRSIVGQTIALDRRPFTVIGVAAEGFQGTGVRAGDVWVPVSMIADARGQSSPMLSNRGSGWLLLGGRLQSGISIDRAAAELDGIGRILEREYPTENQHFALRVLPLSPVPGNNGPIAIFLVLLAAIVSTVLAIACANVAGLLTARAAVRRREIAVRIAIGAGRSRLIRQLLIETVALFLFGGAIGLLMARGMTSLLVSLLPALPFPVAVSLPLDLSAVAFTAGIVFWAALLAGLAPAVHASKADVVTAIKGEPQAGGRLRLRQTFVIAQIALSIVLVVVAGLFVRALQRVGSMDPGFDPRGVELASVDLPLAGVPKGTAPLVARALVDRVRRGPHVQSATIAAVLPGGFEGIGLGGIGAPGVTAPDGSRFMSADWNIVEPGYFTTLRIPILAGRDFTAADDAASPKVAVIGEGIARRFWPGEEVIGKHLVRRDSGVTTDLLVVGVARDPKFGSLIDSTTGLFVFLPLQQEYLPDWTTIVARSTDGRRIADEIRTAVLSENPNLLLGPPQTAEEYASIGLFPQRVAASVAGSLGVVVLLLAAIGIHGVVAYGVTQRTPEIGIRIALGARPFDVLAMILKHGMSFTTIGTVIGLALAAAASRLLSSLLFGVPPIDPVTFSGAAVLFAVIGLAACYFPARRGTRIDPMTALK